MTAFTPHGYQREFIDWCHTHKRCGGFLPMGAGKTVSTLTVISDLMYTEVRKALIVGPKRVVEYTWPDEIEKWDHTRWLSYHVITGKQAKGREPIPEGKEVYLIGKENVAALCKLLGENWDFDLLIIDELSTFKNPQSQRFKALKKELLYTERFIGLTGTPAPKGLPDLWSQIYLMDWGERLGRTLSAFRSEYLRPGRRSGYITYEWLLQPHAEERIYSKIDDLCMSLSPGDCTKLPELTEVDYPVHLTAKEKADYQKFEKEAVLELEDEEITAVNAAALTGKLAQYSSGAIYSEDGSYTTLHAKKLDALDDLMVAAAGQPVLVFYYFKHERERILERFEKDYQISELKSGDIKRWNAGEIDMLLVHPGSAGHGLNLQAGGNTIVWFSLPNWNLELYQQANARLYRQGQKHAVTIYHLLTEGTVDGRMLASLKGKGETQQQLIEALRKEHENAD